MENIHVYTVCIESVYNMDMDISRWQGGREAEQEERQRWVEKERQRIMNSVKGE